MRSLLAFVVQCFLAALAGVIVLCAVAFIGVKIAPYVGLGYVQKR